MKIGSVGNSPIRPVPPAKPLESVEKGEENVKAVKDGFTPSVREKAVSTYSKPDTEAIARLRAESEKAYSALRQLVEQMLERQGMTFLGLKGGEYVEIDEATQVEAAALIAESGELSAEKVSDRIVDFAKALSGGDTGKIGILRGAIEAGFKAASDAFGGLLPEISQRTYDMITQKLDAWMKE